MLEQNTFLLILITSAGLTGQQPKSSRLGRSDRSNGLKNGRFLKPFAVSQTIPRFHVGILYQPFDNVNLLCQSSAPLITTGVTVQTYGAHSNHNRAAVHSWPSGTVASPAAAAFSFPAAAFSLPVPAPV